MPKRVILFLLVFCFLLILVSCGHTVNTKDNVLDTMYSISKAFLNVHYSATVSQAEEYKQLEDEIVKARPSPIPGKNVYNLEDYAPDLAERFEALIKQKYQTQPMTDKVLKLIELNAMPETLWKVVISKGSDIKVTSVKTSLRNNDINDKENDINYTVDLLINKTSYEVNGVLVLILVDNKWMIDDIYVFGWSPSFPN